MRAICIDANLLVLWIVGLTEPKYIAKHKRCNIFDVEDFNRLNKMLEQADVLWVTPNVLTETSNLLAYVNEPIFSRVRATFRNFVLRATERSITSSAAAQRNEFPLLGLTDSALLCASADGAIILTTDFDLWGAAQRAGLPAVNFAHLQN